MEDLFDGFIVGKGQLGRVLTQFDAGKCNNGSTGDHEPDELANGTPTLEMDSVQIWWVVQRIKKGFIKGLDHRR